MWSATAQRGTVGSDFGPPGEYVRCMRQAILLAAFLAGVLVAVALSRAVELDPAGDSGSPVLRLAVSALILMVVMAAAATVFYRRR